VRTREHFDKEKDDMRTREHESRTPPPSSSHHALYEYRQSTAGGAAGRVRAT
jgi:hypothetical protein